MYPNAFKNNNIVKWFCVYAAILVFYVLIGKKLTIGIGSVEDGKKIFIEFAYIFPAIGIYSILNYLKDEVLNRKLMYLSFIFLYCSFLVAVPLMLQYNNIREALGESRSDESLSVPGLPSYQLMHAYTFAIPVLCYLVKSSSSFRKKIVSIALLIVLCFVIYDTFVTTSLVLMVFILLVAFFYNGSNNSLIILGAVLGFIFLFWEIGAFAPLFDWIAPFFDGTPAEGKIEDFRLASAGVEVQGSNLEGRENIHAISWNAFIINPIWGSYPVGGHSQLLDRFGGMGILAGVPYVMIIISFAKYTIQRFTTLLGRACYLIGVFCVFVFLYTKGLWGCEGWLMSMVLMPYGILCLESLKTK